MGQEYVLGHRAEELARLDGWPISAPVVLSYLPDPVGCSARSARSATVVPTPVAAWGHPG